MAMAKLDFERVEDLQAVGFTTEQGRALVRLVADIQTAQLATKADLADLRTELVETRETLRGEIAEVRTELVETREALRGEMSALEQRLTEKMANQELRLTEKMTAIQTKLIIWLIGTAIGIVALVATIFQLMK